MTAARQSPDPLRLTLSHGGREHLLELAHPSCGAIYPLILTKESRDLSTLKEVTALLMKKMVFQLDGQPMTMLQADDLASDEAAAGAFLLEVKRMLEADSERGQAFACCPHCGEWEADLTVPALAVALSAAPWPIFDGPFLARPSLSMRLAPGARPSGLPMASRLRFVPPSAKLGLESPVHGGVLADLNADPLGLRETRAWERWTPPGPTPQPGREDWSSSVPGFRAVLRLCVLLDGVNDGTVSPDVVEKIPAIDFYFLDNLYYMTHNVDVGPGAGVLTCGRCGGRFLFVR